MKRFIFILLLSLLFINCSTEIINFKLINNTEYDVILLDEADYNKSEYAVPKNSVKYIEHYKSSNFTIKDNHYPIQVNNGHSSCQVDYLETYELQIFNQTDNEYLLQIDNDYQGSYIITPKQTTVINIYTKNININILHLYLEKQNVNNFILQDNKLFIL